MICAGFRSARSSSAGICIDSSKIPPRLYSIASSFAANPDEVHLTIGAVRYNAHGRDRKGVCSVLCAERLQPGDTLPVSFSRIKL
ncbi:hypothetical protein PO124_24385 [Bacillus licheniformis]|nr:hypothetical protein [Bacillus licheniformis]